MPPRRGKALTVLAGLAAPAAPALALRACRGFGRCRLAHRARGRGCCRTLRRKRQSRRNLRNNGRHGGRGLRRLPQRMIGAHHARHLAIACQAPAIERSGYGKDAVDRHHDAMALRAVRHQERQRGHRAPGIEADDKALPPDRGLDCGNVRLLLQVLARHLPHEVERTLLDTGVFVRHVGQDAHEGVQRSALLNPGFRLMDVPRGQFLPQRRAQRRRAALSAPGEKPTSADSHGDR
ncbi:hypothetical protein ACU4HD_01530 [Cupriavidus basilensis]